MNDLCAGALMLSHSFGLFWVPGMQGDFAAVS